jgi:hypothetical protein
VVRKYYVRLCKQVDLRGLVKSSHAIILTRNSRNLPRSFGRVVLHRPLFPTPLPPFPPKIYSSGDNSAFSSSGKSGRVAPPIRSASPWPDCLDSSIGAMPSSSSNPTRWSDGHRRGFRLFWKWKSPPRGRPGFDNSQAALDNRRGAASGLCGVIM